MSWLFGETGAGPDDSAPDVERQAPDDGPAPPLAQQGRGGGGMSGYGALYGGPLTGSAVVDEDDGEDARLQQRRERRRRREVSKRNADDAAPDPRALARPWWPPQAARRGRRVAASSVAARVIARPCLRLVAPLVSRAARRRRGA